MAINNNNKIIEVMSKYVGALGLTYLWSKIKSLFVKKDEVYGNYFNN